MITEITEIADTIDEAQWLVIEIEFYKEGLDKRQWFVSFQDSYLTKESFKTYLDIQHSNPKLWLWIFLGDESNPHMALIDKTNHIYHSKCDVEEKQYIIFYDENNNKYRFLVSTCELTPCE